MKEWENKFLKAEEEDLKHSLDEMLFCAQWDTFRCP